jgi:hypothetical protein
MPYLIGFALVPLIAVLLYSFVLFDRLVRVEHEQHRALWEADGRPCGFFWHPKEASRLGSGLACTRLSLIWLFRSPSWISESPNMTATWHRLRFTVLVWNVGVVAWFALFLMSLWGLYG